MKSVVTSMELVDRTIKVSGEISGLTLGNKSVNSIRRLETEHVYEYVEEYTFETSLNNNEWY